MYSTRIESSQLGSLEAFLNCLSNDGTSVNPSCDLYGAAWEMSAVSLICRKCTPDISVDKIWDMG